MKIFYNNLILVTDNDKVNFQNDYNVVDTNLRNHLDEVPLKKKIEL